MHACIYFYNLNTNKLKNYYTYKKATSPSWVWGNWQFFCLIDHTNSTPSPNNLWLDYIHSSILTAPDFLVHCTTQKDKKNTASPIVEMSDQSIPHFRPATLPGQFPESDVRGAAAREAANGREKHPSWVSYRDG